MAVSITLTCQLTYPWSIHSADECPKLGASPLWESRLVRDADGRFQSERGGYVYQVHGSAGSETFTLYWERPSRDALVNIARIEGGGGEAIFP